MINSLNSASDLPVTSSTVGRIRNASIESSIHGDASLDDTDSTISSDSPHPMSPWIPSSPYKKSPWILTPPGFVSSYSSYGLIGSLIREEGHVYSLAAFRGFVFTGSTDGTVKIWRRELIGNKSKHVFIRILMKRDIDVTSIVVNSSTGTVYCGSSDGLVKFLEADKQYFSMGGILRGHKIAVLCPASSGNLMFSGFADKSIFVWRRDHRIKGWPRSFSSEYSIKVL